MLPTWTTAELAYLAGIIDGEGCFCLHRRRGTLIGSTQLQIGNTDLRLLQWVSQHFGGSVKLEKRQNLHHKPVWRWTSTAEALETLTRAVLPFLIVKREQAELLLAYRATVAVSGAEWIRSRGTPAHIREERERIHERISRLNRRGVQDGPMAVNH